MGDRTLRVKGKTNEVAGEAKANVGYDTGNHKTEAKGAGRILKGKAQQATGKARSAVRRRRASRRSSLPRVDRAAISLLISGYSLAGREGHKEDR